MSEGETNHILSNTAIKLALLLADDAVRCEEIANRQEDKILKRIQPAIQDLDQALQNFS